jgi:hypothetical protein
LKRASIAAVLMSVACSSAQQEPSTAAALRAVCRLESVRSAKRIEVVTETAPILQLAALRQALDAHALAPDEIRRLFLAEQRIGAGSSEPVILPFPSECAWQRRPSREPYDDALVIELSKTVPANTAANPTPGIIVRLSAGGRPGGEYYWVPLLSHGTTTEPLPPIRLDVSDG